jgi:hypothetical protein
MQDMWWDHGLKVTGEGVGLAGHAGAVLLRKLADQVGLTGGWDRRWRGPGSSRWQNAVWRWFLWRWRSRWGLPA